MNNIKPISTSYNRGLPYLYKIEYYGVTVELSVKEYLELIKSESSAPEQREGK